MSEIIGRTVHRTIAYVDRGLLRPSVQDASGHGSKRLWSYGDLVRLRLVTLLEDTGFTIPALRSIAPHMTGDAIESGKIWHLVMGLPLPSQEEMTLNAIGGSPSPIFLEKDNGQALIIHNGALET